MDIDYSKYPMGTVVRSLCHDTHNGKPVRGGYLGHIVGFDMVEYDSIFNVVLRVRWFNGEETKMHPSLIEVL